VGGSLISLFVQRENLPVSPHFLHGNDPGCGQPLILIKLRVGRRFALCYFMRQLFTNFGRILAAGVVLVGSTTLSIAQDAPKPSQADQPTADQQKNNKTDRQITQQIRKALMADKSLSTSAHNVKVITQSGTVTLKGTVKSDAEKQAVEAKAAEVAGASNVKDELTVAADQAKP
jgi:hyperosmotically inducible periplasmic protein